MSIPESIITGGGKRKHIFTRVVRDVIPDEIVFRQKQGFGPVYEWFFDKLGDYTRRELTLFCNATDFLDRDAFMQLVDQGKAGTPGFCSVSRCSCSGRNTSREESCATKPGSLARWFTPSMSWSVCSGLAKESTYRYNSTDR